MPPGFAHLGFFLLRLVVLVSSGIVHPLQGDGFALAGERDQKRATGTRAGTSAPADTTLPAPVADIRDAILAAVASGDIEEMRTPLEWNEMKPEIADEPVADVIAYWRQRSNDGQGREILGILGEILSQPYAVLPVGHDAENNRLFVWPRFAEVKVAELSAAEREALVRLVPAPVLAEMSRTGRYLWWRLAIAADGTWHSFMKAK